jgi:hypothetical protein
MSKLYVSETAQANTITNCFFFHIDKKKIDLLTHSLTYYYYYYYYYVIFACLPPISLDKTENVSHHIHY